MNVEKVWSEYQNSLRGFLRNNVSNADDVDDLLQEILIKTYHNLANIHDSKKIKSWLFQIAKNTIIDFYRKKKNQANAEITDIAEVIDVAEATDIADKDVWYNDVSLNIEQQLSACIIPFINELEKEDADLLTAIEINGLSQKAYAQKLGVNYSTLKSRVQKSRSKLYGLFNECCTFSIDNRGKVIDYQAKRSNCSGC